MSPFKQLEPRDEHNLQLESSVHPADWQNPVPTGRYNLVVVGAGTAGLVTAAGAAGLGAKVALVERELMGGDCLNVGCVPSKAVIRAARAAAAVREAKDFGVHLQSEVSIDFPHAMERMRRLRAGIGPHDSAARFQSLGVDVFFGHAEFVNSDTLQVGEQQLKFKRAVIATGGRAQAPPIPGLDGVKFLTNETVFSLTELPPTLGVIGAGPIGCEMAQSFARLGSSVFLVEATHGILPREDQTAAELVRQSLIHDGVTLLCCGRKTALSAAGDRIHLSVESHEQTYKQTVNKLLVAVGRAPNVEGIGLERVGVEFDLQTGVTVNDKLQTTNPRIYAAGDVCSQFKFTHAADFMARIVIRNALFKGRGKVSALTIPWCTYTSPELAHVGLNPAQAEQQGIAIDTFDQPFDGVDRAILDGDSGLVRIHVRKGTDKILGGTVVARNAGDMISELTLAMQHGIGLQKLANTIHPYPTQADAIRKVGDAYNRTRLTPFVKRLFRQWLSWTR